MRTVNDAKTMAKTLRESLARKEIAVSHSECLEIVAQQFGVDNWNVLAAKISTEPGATADGVRFIDTIPILRIFSVEKAMEFYRDFLGFQVDWEHRYEEDFPLYAQVSRAGLKLHLSEHHGDASPGSTVFVWMRGLADFHAELITKKYNYNRPGLEDEAWGLSVTVADPFGNGIRFNEKTK